MPDQAASYQVALSEPEKESHKDLFSPLFLEYLHSGLPGNVGDALHVRWRRRSDCLAPHV